MTYPLILIITSILHFGLRGTCFLNVDKFPIVPGTIYAGHIAYCAILHFLYDIDLVPQRYKCRMNFLASFLFELILGVAIMEIMALWLWNSVEHITHMTLQFVLRQYCGMSMEFYRRWEWAIMGSVMTILAIFLWFNAYEATDPNGKIQQEESKKQQNEPTTPKQQMDKQQKQKQKKTSLMEEKEEKDIEQVQDPLLASQ